MGEGALWIALPHWGGMGGAPKNLNIMSEKSKIRRQQREEREKEQANKVVNWVFAGLIILAIISGLFIALM